MAELPSTVLLPTVSENDAAKLTAAIKAISKEMSSLIITKCLAKLRVNQKATELGANFRALKEAVGHGNFQRYCEEHFPLIGPKQIQRYMRLAEYADEIELINPKWKTQLSWTAALKLLDNRFSPEPIQAVAEFTFKPDGQTEGDLPASSTNSISDELPLGTATGSQSPSVQPTKSTLTDSSSRTANRKRKAAAKRKATPFQEIVAAVTAIPSVNFKRACDQLAKAKDADLIRRAAKRLSDGERYLRRSRERLEKRLSVIEKPSTNRKPKPR